MMAYASLLLIVVLFIGLPDSQQECKIENIKNVPTYACNSLQELEESGSSDHSQFNIYSGKTSTSSSRKLNFQVILIENENGGISPNTFQILKDVSKLLVPNNSKVKLTAGIFANLPLKEIYFKECGITSVEPGAFSNLNDLKNLSIVHNNLTTVRSGIYNNLPLDALSLSHNKISFIEKNAFVDMPSLKKLHLDGNRISDFQPEILISRPETLEELFLNDNYLNQVSPDTVKGLRNLQKLNLKNNRISQCLSYSFEDLSNLEILILSNNMLLDLPPDAFSQTGMPKLKKLYLNDNRLSFLSTTILERWKNLQHVRIAGNPWQCSCLDAILTWLNDHDVQQNCDKDYYDGSRPICVVSDTNSGTCDHNSDILYYYRYSEVNDMAPKNPDCVL